MLVRLGTASHQGTLLSPEGTTTSRPRWGWRPVMYLPAGCLFSNARHDLVHIPLGQCWCESAGCSGFGVGWWVVGWLLVENCTVDASILFFVVKLSRADGGCLGTRSR